MKNGLDGIFARLVSLSAVELDRSTRELVRDERRHTAMVVAHISEISRRELYLERGYKSLFDYCVRRLHLSEGSVWRRIQVANVCRKFPHVLAHLYENRLTLTALGLLAPHLRTENVDRVLAECRGMTRREVEVYVRGITPRPSFEPSIRKTPKRRSRSGGSANRADTERGESTPDSNSHRQRPSEPIFEPASADVFNFRFSASSEFRAKFERLAEVLGGERPERRMEEVFTKALEIALEKEDPERKHERRLEREARRRSKASSSKPCPGRDGDAAGTRGEITLRAGIDAQGSTSRRGIPVRVPRSGRHALCATYRARGGSHRSLLARRVSRQGEPQNSVHRSQSLGGGARLGCGVRREEDSRSMSSRDYTTSISRSPPMIRSMCFARLST